LTLRDIVKKEQAKSVQDYGNTTVEADLRRRVIPTETRDGRWEREVREGNAPDNRRVGEPRDLLDRAITRTISVSIREESRGRKEI